MIQKTLICLLLCCVLSACGDKNQTAVGPPEKQGDNPPTATSKAITKPAIPGSEDSLAQKKFGTENALEQPDFSILMKPRFGDLDEIEQHRFIRVLTVYGLGHYYLDGAIKKGLTYKAFKQFEKHINKQLKKGHLKIHIVLIPVARDELIPALLEGRGDIAAAGLTITPQREKLIDFTQPASNKISEILVTGPSARKLNNIEDLAGELIYVRASSSYRSSIDRLNQQFLASGKKAIRVEDASETLEDEDLLEMVNAGLLDWIIIDDYRARTWAKVFKDIVLREDIVFRQGGQIAFAVRKDSPVLKSSLNTFLKTHRQGTLSGNILFNRHYRDIDWAGHALETADYQRFQALVKIFSTYGKQYGVDYLMLAAQGYQESRLDQRARSKAGAIGIMQMLPATARDRNVGIPDISTAENNIHAGVKYLSFIRQRYFSDPQMDKFNQTLFALAAYNAGPARIARLRNKAAIAGYDPDQWFDNVEIFAAREIGSETVQYVANILKYYVAYRLLLVQQENKHIEHE